MFSIDRGIATGVDIGSYAVKIAAIKRVGQRHSLAAIGYSKLDSIKLPEEGSRLSLVLKNLFSANRIKKKKVVTALSGGYLTTAQLQMPVMPENDLAEAVRWEMRKQVTFPHEELVCDFVRIGEVKKRDEAAISLLAFGARKKDVEMMLSIFEDASLDVSSIDTQATAMLASFDCSNVWEQGLNYSMIDIGDSTTTLTVFRDKRLMFTREMPVAGREITRVVQEKLSCSREQAEQEKIIAGLSAEGEKTDVQDVIASVMERLGGEIHRTFDYYQAQFRVGGIGKIFLCGGTSKLKGIDEFLAAYLGVPCFVDDPLRNLNLKSKGSELSRMREFAPDLTVAVGLAL